MSTELRQPWSVESFLAWAGGQDARYEFDGAQPVAMTGGTVNHGIIMRNLHRALDARLRGTACRPLGRDVGMVTAGDAARYPDALVTCAPLDGRALTVSGVVAVFEIVSPGSGAGDRIIKVREYATVASIRCYVIIESTSNGMLVLHRGDGVAAWTAESLAETDDLRIAALGIEIPVAEVYVNVELPGGAVGK